MLLVLVGSLLACYYVLVYIPDQARNPYRRAGMAEEQITRLFRLYPQQNGNSSCVNLGVNLARLPTLTENAFKCTDSLEKTNEFADYVAGLSNASKEAFTVYSGYLFEGYPELLHPMADLMLLGNATERLGERSGDLVDGMTPGNVWSLVTHLHYTPEVVDEIEELAEALRAKIIREDSVWYDRYGQSRLDDEIWENSTWGRIANWRYHVDTNSKYLNHTYMTESFPNATDREERLQKMWIPFIMSLLDFNSPEPPYSGWTSFDLLKSNMNVTALRIWHDWILSEYNNRTSQFHKDVRDRFSYTYFGDRAGHGWSNSTMQFQKLIKNLSEYTESSEWGREYWKRYYLKDKDLDLLTFIDGFMYELYARGLGPAAKWSNEYYARFAIELGAKALGMSVDSIYSIPTDPDNGISAPAYPILHQIRTYIESHPELFGNYTFTRGSGIGFLSPVEGRIADGATFLSQDLDIGKSITLWRRDQKIETKNKNEKLQYSIKDLLAYERVDDYLPLERRHLSDDSRRQYLVDVPACFSYSFCQMRFRLFRCVIPPGKLVIVDGSSFWL